MDIDEAYEKNTKHTEKDGRHRIDCVKGLFGVDAPTKEEATREAKHYFVQYYMDGEYDSDPMAAAKRVREFFNN